MLRIAALSICVVLAWAGAARADDSSAQAKRLYRSGTTLYNLGEYDKALEEFRSAYRLKSDPAFLFNIAQCQRQLADYEGAERSYRAFLRESPDAPPATQREVQRLIGEMDKAVRDGRARQPPAGTRPPKEEPRPAATAPIPTTPLVTDSTIERAPERPSPLYKKWWLWTAVAVVVVGAAVVVGVAVSQSDSTTRGPFPTVRF